MYETTPGRLAKELDVPRMTMFQVMQELRINAKRMDARLSDRQVEMLRRHFANTRAYQKRSSSRSTSKAPAPRLPTPVPVRDFPRTCPCCDRRWVYHGVDDQVVTLCASCVDHRSVPGESVERQLARAENHVLLYKRDRDHALTEVQRNHELRVAAYESRAKWMAALAKVVLDHEEGDDGLCWCGQTFPCRSWRKLNEANRGIHRQVEKWSSWSDDRLDSFLYGAEHKFSAVIDEDEPEDDTDETET